MLDKLLSLIAPHHCYYCQKTGPILCDCCKNYILRSVKIKPEAIKYNDSAIYLAIGESPLKKLIYYYKLNSVRALSQVFAEIIYKALPLSHNTAIVPIPTIKRSRRQRGFGHMEEIGQELARLSGWQYSPILSNDSKLAQKDLKSKQRRQNINQHLKLQDDLKIDINKIYLVIDDITTTGATLERARELLLTAGAKKVICLALVHK